MQPTDYALGMPLVALGMILIVGGIVGLAWIFRYELGYDEPDVPPVVQPDPARTAIFSAVMPEPNYHRPDDDTHVIRPYIPGATPEERTEEEPAELEPFLKAIDDATAELAALANVPLPLLARPGVSAWETFEQIEGLRVIPSAGPVCPTCGGPFGACACYGQKSAPTSTPEETQVVDLCPLTTQDIVIDSSAPHFAETFTRHPRAELGTQELSGSLARAKERAA